MIVAGGGWRVLLAARSIIDSGRTTRGGPAGGSILQGVLRPGGTDRDPAGASRAAPTAHGEVRALFSRVLRRGSARPGRRRVLPRRALQ